MTWVPKSRDPYFKGNPFKSSAGSNPRVTLGKRLGCPYRIMWWQQGTSLVSACKEQFYLSNAVRSLTGHVTSETSGNYYFFKRACFTAKISPPPLFWGIHNAQGWSDECATGNVPPERFYMGLPIERCSVVFPILPTRSVCNSWDFYLHPQSGQLKWASQLRTTG